MFNALVLYKQVLIGAVMDFYSAEDVFPFSIHRELGRICEFKGTEKDFKTRGGTYFK